MIGGASIAINHDGHLRSESNCMKKWTFKIYVSEVEAECTLLLLNHFMRKIQSS
jgi:hypothetical protein